MGLIDRIFKPANPITAADADKAAAAARGAAAAAERKALETERPEDWTAHHTALVRVQQAEARHRAAREREDAEAKIESLRLRQADETEFQSLSERLASWRDDLRPLYEELQAAHDAAAATIVTLQRKVIELHVAEGEARALARKLGSDAHVASAPTLQNVQGQAQRSIYEASKTGAQLQVAVAHWFPQTSAYASRLMHSRVAASEGPEAA